ncbi:MAG: hypothetical protein ABH840_01715 [Nanoarchaeota archaeon]
MPIKKIKATKLPLLVYIIAIILFILAIYFIFLGVSTWNKYYFNSPAMNSSQLDMNSKLEAKGLPNLNQLTAWSGLFPALFLGLFLILVSIFLLRKKNWARGIAIVISLFVGLISLLITFGNWTNLPYAVIGLVVGIYLLIDKKVRLAFISNKNQRDINKRKKGLKGLGGWLIIIQVVLILNVLSYLIFFLMFLISPTYKDYNVALVFILYLLLVMAIVLNSLVIFLMYKKRKSFLFYAKVFVCYDIVITFLFFNVVLSIANLIQMGAIIYYLKKSIRVKNTFVNR